MFRATHRVAWAIAIALCAITPLTSASSVLPEVSPSKVGLSQERLDRISAIIQKDIDDGHITGAAAMIIRKGQIGYYENFGFSDREKQIPTSNDTIYRIYSMSKPITSVALMMLFEEGKFFLDDPVSKYIPELGGLQVVVDTTDETGPSFNIPDEDPTGTAAPSKIETDIATVPAKRDMTIRDLMRHTAGLTYGLFGNTDVDKMYQKMGILMLDKDLKQMVEKVSTAPLLFQPGERWHYSISVDVMGRLVEVLSGQSFDVFLQDRIFAPLAMHDTGFYVPKDQLDRLAQLYSPAQSGEGIEPALSFISRNFVNQPTFFSGGGGLVSTTPDYARFCQMLLNGGKLDGARIISRPTIELMTKDHCQDASIGMRAGGSTFGLGFAVVLDQGLSASQVSEGSYSWGGAAGTAFWIDPKEELIGIYMMQNLPPQLPFGEVFKNMVYQSIDD
ncbi:MAG: serine hydrolase domain-containing protein [Candidatus Hydrogenedentota bacterium]